MSTRKVVGLIVCVLFLSVMVAQADTVGGPVGTWSISYWSNTIPDQDLNFIQDLTFEKFHYGYLGTLQSIELTLYGHVAGSMGYENQSQSEDPVDQISVGMNATMYLYRPGDSFPGNPPIVVTIPTITEIAYNVPQYDGTPDYGGTSGHTYSGIDVTKSEYNTLTGASDITLFSGLGTIDLPVDAQGTSFGSGGSNVIRFWNEDAGAWGKVTYTWEGEDIPEPATMTLFGLGLLGLGAWRRRRTAA